MKVGGTSMGEAVCIKRAAEIVAAETKESALLVVVSKMGGYTYLSFQQLAHRFEDQCVGRR